MTNTTNLLTVPLTLVHDDGAVYTASGMRVPSQDVRSRKIAEDAARWLAFAEDRTRMKRPTLVAKALSSVAFSVQHGARTFAVPSKLTGTKAHQQALWTMVRGHVAPWTELEIHNTSDGLAVRYGDDLLGEVQRKHLGWTKPLVSFGLRLYLARVTGHDYEAYTLGCNVVFGHVGAALTGLQDALGGDLAPSNGIGSVHASSGDGAATEPVLTLSKGSQIDRSGTGGDGSSLRLIVSGGVPVHPEHDTVRPDADPDDVVLFRRVDGTPCCSVDHVVRHSPTGIDWGRTGSGPADLALSVLLALVDEPTAEALYPAFETEVVTRVPYAGGVLRAADVRDWAARQPA